MYKDKVMMAIALFIIAGGIFVVKNEIDKVHKNIQKLESISDDVQNLKKELDSLIIRFKQEQDEVDKFQESMALFAKNTVLQLQGLPK